MIFHSNLPSAAVLWLSGNRLAPGDKKALRGRFGKEGCHF
jgi:hypothetical protein